MTRRLLLVKSSTLVEGWTLPQAVKSSKVDDIYYVTLKAPEYLRTVAVLPSQ